MHEPPPPCRAHCFVLVFRPENDPQPDSTGSLGTAKGPQLSQAAVKTEAHEILVL